MLNFAFATPTISDRFSRSGGVAAHVLICLILCSGHINENDNISVIFHKFSSIKCLSITKNLVNAKFLVVGKLLADGKLFVDGKL